MYVQMGATWIRGKKKPGRCLLSLVKGAFFEKGEGEREMDGEMFFPDQR